MKRKYEGTFFGDKPEKAQKSNQDPAIDIKKFNIPDYYRMEIDLFLDNANAVVPTYQGSLLIAQYYSIQHGTNITLPASRGLQGNNEGFYENPDFSLSEARNKNRYRQAFVLGMDGLHAVPVIYFKENEQEGLLFADTYGASDAQKAVAENIYKKTGIPVYLIALPRQADTYSCYTDSLLMSIKSTAINQKTKEYEIADFPVFIRKNARKMKKKIEDKIEIMEGVFSTRLPDAMLITCQISNFLDFHREKDESKIIHKKETLNMFRGRYTDRNILLKVIDEDSESFKTVLKDIYTYPRKKSFKFADIMIMQFYLNQIHDYRKDLPLDERAEFIGRAKEILNLNVEFEHKTQDLMQLSRDYIRAGLSPDDVLSRQNKSNS